MKSFLKVFERVFSFYYISMAISFCITLILNIPLKFLVKNFNDMTNFIVYIISFIIAIFILFCIDGYKSKKFEFKLLLLSTTALLAILIIIVSIIGRAVYISGPTDFLANYILYKVNPYLINGKVMLDRYCMGLMIFAFIFLYMPLIILAEHLGVRIRNKQLSKYKINQNSGFSPKFNIISNGSDTMKIFEQFTKTKPITMETEFVKIYKLSHNKKDYEIIIPKRTANRHSIIHCIDDYIAWEQAPLFPRLVGRIRGIKTPIYKFAPKKDCATIFIIKGKPNGIIGLDDGIFRSAHKFDNNFLNVISYHQFKKL